MSFISIDTIVTALVIAAGVGVVIFAGAEWISSTVVEFRASRLPAELCARLSEEWSAEVRQIENRTAKLAFAFGLLMAPNRSFELPETWQSLEFDGKDDLRIYSDYSARIVAALIDTGVQVAITLLAIIVSKRALGAIGADGLSPSSIASALVNFSCAMCVYAMVYVYCVVRFGGSPGKIAMGLRIVTVDGSSLTAKHAVARISPWLIQQVTGSMLTIAILLVVTPEAIAGKSLPDALLGSPILYWMTRGFANIACLYSLADVSVFWATEHRRSLRDLIAGTVVILRVPDTVEVPAQASAVRSTSMFR